MYARRERAGPGKVRSYARTPTPYGGLSYTVVASTSTTWQRSLPFRQPDETATHALSTRRTGDHTTYYLLLNTSQLLRFPFLVRHAYASMTYSWTHSTPTTDVLLKRRVDRTTLAHSLTCLFTMFKSVMRADKFVVASYAVVHRHFLTEELTRTLTQKPFGKIRVKVSTKPVKLLHTKTQGRQEICRAVAWQSNLDSLARSNKTIHTSFYKWIKPYDSYYAQYHRLIHD